MHGAVGRPDTTARSCQAISFRFCLRGRRGHTLLFTRATVTILSPLSGLDVRCHQVNATRCRQATSTRENSAGRWHGGLSLHCISRRDPLNSYTDTVTSKVHTLSPRPGHIDSPNPPSTQPASAETIPLGSTPQQRTAPAGPPGGLMRISWP